MKFTTDRPHYWLFAILALVGFVADQTCKYVVFAKLTPPEALYEIIPNHFNLRTAYTGDRFSPAEPFSFLRTISGDRIPHVNQGALFGIGNGDAGSGGYNLLFAGISVLAASFILVWALRPMVAQDRFLSVALGLILGGTLGNLYDRMIFGGVRDFLHCYYGTHVWPDFNIADCCLVCGAGVLLVHSFFIADKKDEPATNAEPVSSIQATAPTNGV